MIDISNVQTFGWEAAIRGMRNPLNSWDKSDSLFARFESTCSNISGDYYEIQENDVELRAHGYTIGPNDHTLCMKLVKAGSEHAKFRRMIMVSVDIIAPLYWWKEFDPYKVGTVANSCSTMHKIQAKEFVYEDFSCEHLMNKAEDLKEAFLTFDSYGYSIKDVLGITISVLNYARQKFLETQDKRWWWQMIQLLPSSYNQKRTIMLNYEVLANIYRQRKNHKLDEWHTFCDWIESLPYSEFITGEEKSEK